MRNYISPNYCIWFQGAFFVFKSVSWICCVSDLKESRIYQMVAAQPRDCAVMITNLTPLV